MIQIIKKLRVLLDKKQKRTMVGLIILMVISAFLQTAGVGMLVEVMQIVIDPEAVQHGCDRPVLNRKKHLRHFQEMPEMLFYGEI